MVGFLALGGALAAQQLTSIEPLATLLLDARRSIHLVLDFHVACDPDQTDERPVPFRRWVRRARLGLDRDGEDGGQRRKRLCKGRQSWRRAGKVVRWGRREMLGWRCERPEAFGGRAER